MDLKVSPVKREGNVSQWHQFFRTSLRENTSFKAFESAVLHLLLHHRLDGPGILEAWTAAHDGGSTVRLRHVKYFEQLLQLRLITHVDVLRRMAVTTPNTIFAADRLLIKSGVAKGEYRQCVEAVMLERLAYHLLRMRNGASANDRDRVFAFRTRRPLLALLVVFVQATAGMNMLQGPALTIGMELGKYVGVFINDLSLVGILTCEAGGAPKVVKKSFGRILPPFINVISTGSSDIAQSLVLLQQQSGLYESPGADASDDEIANSLNAITFQQSVVDAPLVVTRAALYVFLNAMLAGRPICDDPALFTFLNSRYDGAVESLVVDLVTASFDVLANAINRTEPTESINLYRSFLINKVPVLLESFAPMLYLPATIESCITNAVRSMDPSTDPYATQAFDLLSSSGMLSEARQEFLFACALYGLLPESSIETILGDVTMQSLPAAGKHDRVQLVAQCTADPARIAALVDELDNFEGQAAEIVAALVQIVRDCCAGQDSITLKGICNILARKMQALDVLLLFAEPKAILQPLCELLDSWPDAEEHSEYHPVYDEFGSIFLLVLVFRQRFDLQVSDLGISAPDSFIRQYLDHGLTPTSPDSLSDAQRTQLGGWVKGLYDSEGNLSDDPMSTCGPKAFHLLVATLFDQSLKANQAGLIPASTLQGGLSYFLEPFLLPSLVTGLGWAARRLWETPSSPALAAVLLDHLVPLLTALLRPASLSSDAKALHAAVLTTAAAPLERALTHVQALHPRRTDLEPLRAALAPRVPPLRIAAQASTQELESWAVGTPGGFVHGIKHAFRCLVAWSAQAQQQSQQAAGSAPGASQAPQYTQRQLVHALRATGAATTYGALLDEAQRLTDGPPAAAPGSAHPALQVPGAPAAVGAHAAPPPVHPATTYPPPLVLDVLASLVAAPIAAPPRALLSLRRACATAAAEAYALSQNDRGRAELMVRVERRVAAQTLAPGNAGHGGEPGADGGGMDGVEGHGGDAGEGIAPGAGQGGGEGGDGMEDILMGMGERGGTAGQGGDEGDGFGMLGADGGMLDDDLWG